THIMTMHMDTAVTHPNWLPFLRSKISGKVAAAGVRMDKVRTPEGGLHILGCLLDFQVFRALDLDFYPQLPQYDVGDRLTVHLRGNRSAAFACHTPNSEPELMPPRPDSSPSKHVHMATVFDEDGNLTYLHMGRGARKSQGNQSPGLPPQEW